MSSFGNNEVNIIKNSLNTYIKDHGKYPTLDKLIEDPTVGFFFQQIQEDDDLVNEFLDVLFKHYKEKISNPDGTKMRKTLAEVYKNNEKLFDDFFILNLDRKNIKTEKFQTIGTKIQALIQEAQEYVVGKVESGKQYNQYSSSLNDKFVVYIKEFFPLYDNIGLIIK